MYSNMCTKQEARVGISFWKQPCCYLLVILKFCRNTGNTGVHLGHWAARMITANELGGSSVVHKSVNI